MKFNIRNIFYSLIFGFLTCALSPAKADYYKLKIYHVKTQAQADRLDAYLEHAYLPAMHKLGVKNVGVFKPIKADTSGMLIYVFVPFKTLNQLETLEQKLISDQDYLAAGKDYIEASYKNAPYTRMETIVLSAFPKMPEPSVPNLTTNKLDRVYELRSYESPTEAYNVNKVKMFNVGDEVALFKRLGFNAIFYSEVIAGSHMPNLMYMTTFANMDEHDKHWKAFNNDVYWKTLSAKAEYQNNVSHADIFLLHPTEYSDF
jgi:hypothetical protein